MRVSDAQAGRLALGVLALCVAYYTLWLFSAVCSHPRARRSQAQPFVDPASALGACFPPAAWASLAPLAVLLCAIFGGAVWAASINTR